MNGQLEHEVLPWATHDELARQNFVQSLKIYLAGEVSPGNKVVYEKRVKPAFERQHGRPPRDRRDVRQMMTSDPYYQMWSALQRTSQEMMWDAVSTSVERQLEELARKAGGLKSKLGSLTLDPSLPVPPYHAAVDIHCQPGGYHTELRKEDVTAGAIYDRAVYIYAMGRMGALNDDMGASVVAYLKQKYKGFRPAKILDMGCSVGHSTLPYVDAYSEAEVHAIDVAAPMLRYAHARAEALGRRVHRSMPRCRSMQEWILTMLSCSIGTPTTTTSRSGVISTTWTCDNLPRSRVSTARRWCRQWCRAPSSRPRRGRVCCREAISRARANGSST